MSDTTHEPNVWATYQDIAKLVFKYAKPLHDDRANMQKTFGIEDDVEPSEDAEDLANDLQRMGPTFVKLGQTLSTRPDVIPPTWLEPLSRLQDEAGTVSTADIHKIIAEDLGAKPSTLFETFEDKPLASASIGQVHRATLRDSNREVVVKVQRPGIQERVQKELEALAKVAGLLADHTALGKKYDLRHLLERFRETIQSELDFGREARNLTTLGANLKRFKRLHIPKPVPDFVSRRVLVMDYLPGQKLTKLSDVIYTELDGPALAAELFDAYLQQILVDGFFHADPHPGNILLDPNRELVLLDLGMVGTLSQDLKGNLLKLLSAVADSRSDAAAALTIKIGQPKENFDEHACRDAIKKIVEARRGMAVSDLDVGSLILEVTKACADHGLKIPGEVYLLGKMLLNLDHIAKKLDPEFKPEERIRAQIQRLMHQRLREDLSLGNLILILSELKDLVAETPGRVNTILSNLSRNKLELKLDVIDEYALLKAIHRVANRITAGLIISAMIVGAAMMMKIDSGWKIFGYPGLAILFFLMAAFSGIFLVGNILLSEFRPKSKHRR